MAGNREVRGAYTGTGSAISVRTVGFRPSKVVLKSAAGDEATWTDSMADAAMHKRVAAGTGSLATSGGITPLADGFSIGTDSDLNASGEVVYWIATDR